MDESARRSSYSGTRDRNIYDTIFNNTCGQWTTTVKHIITQNNGESAPGRTTEGM